MIRFSNTILVLKFLKKICVKKNRNKMPKYILVIFLKGFHFKNLRTKIVFENLIIKIITLVLYILEYLLFVL